MLHLLLHPLVLWMLLFALFCRERVGVFGTNGPRRSLCVAVAAPNILFTCLPLMLQMMMLSERAATTLSNNEMAVDDERKWQ